MSLDVPRPASDGSEQTAEDGARPEDGPVGRLRSVLPGGGSDWLLVAVGVGLGLLVVTDGSPLARLVRGLLLVAALRSALLATTGHNLIRLTGGVTGVVLGLAFGVRYSAFGAWEWRTVIGWIELAAGVTLLTVALVDIGRGRTFILLSGQRLAALLASLAIVFVVTPPVMAVNVPPVRPQTPERLGADVEFVEFPADDLVILAGWYVPSSNGSVVIVRHGAGRSTAASVAAHAGVLIKHGYGVLLTDARGHGRSDGRAMDFGWYGERDIDAAVTYVLGRPDVDPERIAVLGLSMGGEEAIGAIGTDPRINAVVAEGATARTAADKVWLSQVYGWRGWVQRSVDVATFGLTELLSGATRPDALAAAARRARPQPILLITAGDVADEAHAAAHISATAGPHVETWTVPDAGHTRGLDTDPVGWEWHVIDFLDRALFPDGR